MAAAWRAVRDAFRAAGLDTPELDARLLAERAFGMERLELTQREREPAEAGALARLHELQNRRLGGEPVARILGEKEFWGLNFGLNAATLVPRPETELLVERGVAILSGIASPRILDLGTGTGCIPIALLTELPDAQAVAVDLSAEALAMAKQNAQRHDVLARLDLRQGDWFVPVAGERFALITANPPYIETASLAGLQREVREHDPALALDGGTDGLAAYRNIAAGASAHLAPGGALLLEIGWDQAEAVTALLGAAGFSRAEVVRDLAGLNRMIVATI